jgi:hypothetical protein
LVETVVLTIRRTLVAVSHAVATSSTILVLESPPAANFERRTMSSTMVMRVA